MSEDGDWVAAEDAPTRLILDLSENFDPNLLSLIDSGSVAAVTASPASDHIEALSAHCVRSGVALIARIGSTTDAQLDPSFNGCALTGPASTKAWRQRQGSDFIIGTNVGTSRHDAVVAGEAGADYVVFGGMAGDDQSEDTELMVELCQWWGDLMVLPCAVAGAPTAAGARRLALAGADFIIIGDTAWQAGTSPQEVLEAHRQAISNIRRE
ncbi:MAG: thiamine phosphate synthase [Pseudomonadota bacterium]